MAIESFGFLYGEGANYIEGEERYRNIKARNLKSACNKMIRVLVKLEERHGQVWLDEDVDYRKGVLSLHDSNHEIQRYL